MAAVARFDKSADLCVDFYQYVCGSWIRTQPQKLDRQYIAKAAEEADRRSRAALTQILTGKNPPANTEIARLRTFFTSCLTDDAASNALADRQLAKAIANMATFENWDQFSKSFIFAQQYGIHAFIRYSGEPNVLERTKYRGEIHQGDFGQNRLLFINPDTSPQGRLTKYQNHIERMFILSGLSQSDAHQSAKSVVAIEATLARASLTFSERFDPAVSNNPTSPNKLAGEYPAIPLTALLQMVNHQQNSSVNVTSPRYLRTVDEVLSEASVSSLRAYMRWRVLDSTLSALPTRFRDERKHFISDFSGTAPRLRHDECILETVKGMGIELSREFSHRTIGIRSRDLARQDADLIRVQLINSVDGFTWLSREARQGTKEKLRLLDFKIGFPNEWPATGRYELRADDYFSNLLETKRFEEGRGWKRAWEPRSRFSWEITVYPNGAPGLAVARLTIPNGFPDVFTNSVILTAAYLQPPQYDGSAALETRLGGFGTTVGHELVHVLENYEFDKLGEARTLWSAADKAAHAGRSMCMVKLGNAFPLPDGSRLDGQRTVGENNADLGGVALSYAALARKLGPALTQRDSSGFTRAQKFFIAYARNTCAVETDEFARNDGHGPPKFRVNAILANLPAFSEAFGCQKQAPMRIPVADQCKVW